MITKKQQKLFTELLETEEKLLSLEPEWNKLLQESSSNNIFLTWEWVSSWWEFFKEEYELFIITVRSKDGRLIGIAPLKVAKRFTRRLSFRHLEFIGYGDEVSPDYLDFIVLPDQQKMVVKEFISCIWSNKDKWDLIDLTDILEDSYNIKLIIETAGEGKRKFKLESKCVCPYIRLPDTWDEYYKSLKKSLRKDLRYGSKLLKNEHNLRYFLVHDKDDLKVAMECLFRLHSERFKERDEKGGSFKRHKHSKIFYQNIASLFFDKGWLKLYFLEVDDERVVAINSFLYEDRILLFNMGFNDNWSQYSPYKKLLAFVIEDSIRSGLKELDFLRGDEEYKYKWTTLDRRLVKLKLWNNNFKGYFHIVLHNLQKLYHLRTGALKLDKKKEKSSAKV